MDKEIKPFVMTGVILEKNLVASKENLIRELEAQIRDTGYVPHLDLDPVFVATPDFDDDKLRNFELTIYGSKCKNGEDPWQVAGVSNGRVV